MLYWLELTSQKYYNKMLKILLEYVILLIKKNFTEWATFLKDFHLNYWRCIEEKYLNLI